VNVTILQGNCVETLKQLPDGSVQCVVTSPPYYGLRDYGAEGQIGLEETPEAYVEKLVQVFREVWRVLKDDGTLWLNLGDTYASAWACNRRNVVGSGSLENGKRDARPNRLTDGLKEKDLIGIPWMVAFALRADGWYLRQDIIWNKPNPMPESVKDRCTKSHEYIFLLTKSAQYYYDHEAIKEPAAEASLARWAQDVENQEGSDRVPGKTNGKMKAVGGKAQATPRNDGNRWNKNNGRGFTPKNLEYDGQKPRTMHLKRLEGEEYSSPDRNKRSVWTVTTKPYKEAHFATFPPDLIEPCILAGSRPGDTVLDPFNGSGTTGAVSIYHHRDYIGCELNPKYIELTNRRLAKVQPLLMSEQ
jgi:DNA modification methylase